MNIEMERICHCEAPKTPKQSHFRRLAQLQLFIMTVLFLTACGPVGESAIKEILEKDPSFEKLLEAKKQIKAKIVSLKTEFDRERRATAQKMRSLKEALKTEKTSLNAQILSLKQETNPGIRALETKLQDRHSEYELTKKNLKDALSKLANIQRLLGKKSELSLSGDEIAIWNRRARDLEKEINSLQADLDKLREKTRILKTEIRILKD